jgi:hypothetical protein
VFAHVHWICMLSALYTANHIHMLSIMCTGPCIPDSSYPCYHQELLWCSLIVILFYFISQWSLTFCMFKFFLKLCHFVKLCSHVGILFYFYKNNHLPIQGHGHWVNSLALSTEYVLRTGPYDHTGKTYSTAEEMKEVLDCC